MSDEVDLAGDNPSDDVSDTTSIADDDTDTQFMQDFAGGKTVKYTGGDWINGIPSRSDIVTECSNKATDAMLMSLQGGQPIHFLPVDVDDVNEYNKGGPSYVLRMYGILIDGSKAEVILTNVPVFFDVQVPDGAVPVEIEQHLRSLLMTIGAATFETVKAFPDRGYRPADQPATFKRVYLPNLQMRRAALEAVHAAAEDPKSGLYKVATKSDDRSSYYRKAAREGGLPLSDWAIMTDYTYTAGLNDRSPLCAHQFRVDVNGFKPLVDPLAPRAEREVALAARAANPLLARDRTLILAWDIETHSGRGTGDVPAPEHAADHAFMICLTVHWKDDATPLRRVCIVDVDTAPDSRWLTIVCGTPLNVLRAFVLCFRSFAPDIIIGFNDSGYDWPFIVGKARSSGLIGWMVQQMSATPRAVSDESASRWNYREMQKIKISAEETLLCSYLKVPGCVTIDVRACFKKLFPRSETPVAGSLKFYLAASGLPGKADMPIRKMWRAYEAAKSISASSDDDQKKEAADGMRAVAHYCVIDAERCQALMVRRAVLGDYREVSTLAFVSLADSHYYAGGMKVCNLLGAYAWRRNILLTMVAHTDTNLAGKYPGAYVFPPEKGIVPDPARLAAVESAISALASQAEASQAEASQAEASQAEASQAEASQAEAKANLAKALEAFAPDRPVTGLDFSSLYPSLIMAYNLSPERFVSTLEEANMWKSTGRDIHPVEFPYGNSTVRGWFVRHKNDQKEIGLYPSVLIDLFAKRAEVKVVLGVHGATREQIGVIRARSAADAISLLDAAALVRADSAAEAEEAAKQLEACEAVLKGASTVVKLAPGATLEDECADASRRRKQAAAATKELDRIIKICSHEKSELAFAEALEIEQARADFDYVCANAKQGALKVYMNTFYGEAGNSLSPLFLLPLAGGVTSAGKDNIQAVAEFVREKGFGLKYGDSVTGDTALIIRAKESKIANQEYRFAIIRTDELASYADSQYLPYGDKLAATLDGIEVWRDGGFTPVKRVIKHDYDGEIIRVCTSDGLVDCTTDHSLLRPDGGKVSPKDVEVGSELLKANDETLIDMLFQNDNLSKLSFANGQAFADAMLRPMLLKVPLIFESSVESLREFMKGFICKSVNGFASKSVNGFADKSVNGFADPLTLDAFPEPTTGWQLRVPVCGKVNCTVIWLIGRRLGWKASIQECTWDPRLFHLTFTSGQPNLDYVPSLSAKVLNKSSLLPIANRYTCLPGQSQIVYDLETESGHFHVGPGDLVVHNTDSLYLTCPSAHFAECDAEFAAKRMTREEWWSAQVRVTIRAMNLARDEVNTFLRARSGGPYLKMAYEEVLYPVVFTGKKKYFGIPHVSEVNFRPKDLFVRGIDVVKQGQPGLARELGFRIMWACVSLNNARPIRAIVEDALKEAIVNGSQWGFDHFVKTDAWKPLKNNVAVHRFIARMRARRETAPAAETQLYNLPEPGERFSYVIVRTGAAFDLKGRKYTPSKGERMEFAKVARELNLEVDVSYYIMQYVVGLCARFINSEAAFATPAEVAANGDEKRADELAQKAAKSALETFVRSLGGLDPATMRRRGFAYRRAYSAASSVAKTELVKRLGAVGAAILQNDFDKLANPSASETVEELWKSAGEISEKALGDCVSINAAMTKALGIDMNGSDLQANMSTNLPANLPANLSANMPANLSTNLPVLPQSNQLYTIASLFECGNATRRVAPNVVTRAYSSALDRLEASARDAIAKALPLASAVALRYEADLSRLVHEMRAREHEVSPELLGGILPGSGLPDGIETRTNLLSITEEDRKSILVLRNAIYQAAGVQMARARRTSFIAHLNHLKLKRTGGAVTPPRMERAAIVAAAAASMKPTGKVAI